MARTITLDTFLTRAEALTAEPSDARPVLDHLKSLEQAEEKAFSRLTLPSLEPGEQYRFHFDMTRCIGCRCCEVACNEQNGNPAEVTWRRVGEVEGGEFPHVRRYHLSMACNHCLEPSCLEGCPTDAYIKLENGIVKHNADSCIGCQYCTWNCPYGVPQYNPERRIVTKCHMCGDRMGQGGLPACVEACPVQAIQIEKVNVEEWRKAIDQANAPGVPPADLTLSTTRITLPKDLPEDFAKHAPQKLTPEPAHWSLVYFLTVGQASVGAATMAPVVALLGATALSGSLSVLALAIGHAALAGTLFHLGRPAHAWKALRAYRRSWLSREVVAFSAYAGLAILPAADFALRSLLKLSLLPTSLLYATLSATALSGLAGVYTSVRIYRIPARPAWNSARTTVGFFLSSAVLGPALALAAGAYVGPTSTLLVRLAASVLALAMGASAFVPWTLARAHGAGEPSIRSSALLLDQHFRVLLLARTAAAAVVTAYAALVALAVLTPSAWTVLALVLALFVECAGRYLFFRCVVPRNMPLSFFSEKPAH